MNQKRCCNLPKLFTVFKSAWKKLFKLFELYSKLVKGFFSRAHATSTPSLRSC